MIKAIANDKQNSITVLGLFEELKTRILSIDNAVSIRETTKYYAFRTNRHFAEVHLYKDRIGIHLRNLEYADPEHRVRTVPDSHLWTMNTVVELKVTSELDYIMKLILQSYQDVSLT